MSAPDTRSVLVGPEPPPATTVFPKADSLDDEPEVVEAAPQEIPTDSHELAKADHDEKGAAQLDHGQIEVRDLGWNDPDADVPKPLVGGLPNEELWTLVRRFNKVRPRKSVAKHWGIVIVVADFE